MSLSSEQRQELIRLLEASEEISAQRGEIEGRSLSSTLCANVPFYRQ
jgi:hypothetical protein